MEVVEGQDVHIHLVRIQMDLNEPWFRRSQPIESRLFGQDDRKVGQEAGGHPQSVRHEGERHSMHSLTDSDTAEGHTVDDSPRMKRYIPVAVTSTPEIGC